MEIDYEVHRAYDVAFIKFRFVAPWATSQALADVTNNADTLMGC